MTKRRFKITWVDSFSPTKLLIGEYELGRTKMGWSVTLEYSSNYKGFQGLPSSRGRQETTPVHPCIYSILIQNIAVSPSTRFARK